MEVNKLEGKEVYILVFGGSAMLFCVVILAFFAGHWITAKSNVMPIVQVMSATPKIDVNVPPAQVSVTTPQPRVDFNVPQGPIPIVNVTTPPAVVTVIEKEHKEQRIAEVKEQSKDVKQEQTKPAPVVSPPPAAAPKPATVEAEKPNKTSVSEFKADFREEDLNMDTLYRYAEKYIDSYCKKNSLDSSRETTKWTKNWQQGLSQAMNDNTDTNEQSYINRVVIQKRNCFDLEKATPEQIVEGCRLMLRYRDGQLAWLQAMKDAATNENLKKTLVFLAAGVRQ